MTSNEQHAPQQSDQNSQGSEHQKEGKRGGWAYLEDVSAVWGDDPHRDGRDVLGDVRRFLGMESRPLQ